MQTTSASEKRRIRRYIIVLSVKHVIVDTTVMSKAIAHPTDSCLLERCREHLGKAAALHVALQIGRYTHATPSSISA